MNQPKTMVFVAKVVAVSFLVGALTVFLDSGVPAEPARFLLGGLTGAMIGTGCMVVEIAFLSNGSIRWLRRVPIAVIVLMRTAAYSMIILVSLVLPALVFLGAVLWREPDFWFNFWVSITIAITISASIELLRLLGKEASLAMFTGRYRRPRQENRIVMFADLTGSTALAERLGDLRFHELLADVVYDLDEPIAASGGEIHRYVGDAIIATWSMDKPLNADRSLACAAAMIDTLVQKAPDYVDRYGQAMHIRIALHCGAVAAGEVGAWKKEIALLGDTMNSAARIESAARDFGVDIVLSDALRVGLSEDWRARLQRLPDYTAHGKNDALRLWSLPARASSAA